VTRTTEQLLELYTQGFVDTRAGVKLHRPQSIEPAYVIGAHVAKVQPKLPMLDACTMFHNFLLANIDPPANQQTIEAAP
jgi:hypothetical protein